MTPKILLVDDERDMRELLGEFLTNWGATVETAADDNKARELLERDTFDAVVTDLALGSSSGLDVCALTKQIQPGLPVLVVTGYGSMDAAIEAIRAGAYDFITKPVDPQMLGVAVERAVEYRRVNSQLKELEEQLRDRDNPGELVGECPPMQRVYDMIRRVRDSPSSVLISGESGTGKELVARALHTETHREKRPFVGLNCAAVPSSLLESELFGHAKGAFTDARGSRPGLFEQANGGSLFLDEISEMQPDMQAKLLRVLQERTVRPVGSSQEIPIDARIIAATNRDLEQDVEQGKFREDLFYRLNVVQIFVPPLRVRGNDILLLAKRFVEMSAGRLGRDVKGVSPEAAHLLLNYDWPGNVRQLQNCIERAVTLTRFDHITPYDLPEKIRGYQPSTPSHGMEVDQDHVLPLEVMERRYIEHVLNFSKGNKSQAARLLGVDRRTLYRKLERYEKARAETANHPGDNPAPQASTPAPT